jgi:AraC-like DNA-binding protein
VRLPPDLPRAAPMLLWPPVFATHGPGDASVRHAHHAMHLLVARAGVLGVRGRGRAAAVLTAPDVVHAIDGTGVDVVLLFVEPESDAGARLAAALAGPIRLFDERERRDLLLVPGPGEPMPPLGEWIERVLARLGGDAPARQVHPGVARALRRLRADEVDPSLAALACVAGLSEGRFAHAFTESVGIPLKRYLLWLKLQRAATLLVAGRPLAATAVAAGFSDASHMTRTFRRMFGVTPSRLARAAAAFKTRAPGGSMI